MRTELRQKAERALMEAGFVSCVGALLGSGYAVIDKTGFVSRAGTFIRSGYGVVDGELDDPTLGPVEAIFRRTLRDGVVFTPCLFLSWDKMREEARRYHEALEQQGIPADRFEYDHPELFASYVFVQNTPTSTTGQVVVIRAGREKKRGW